MYRHEYEIQNLVHRCALTIESCNDVHQLLVADKYCELAVRRAERLMENGLDENRIHQRTFAMRSMLSKMVKFRAGEILSREESSAVLGTGM